MPATQQQPKFTPQEAERFAALVAGGDTSNPSEPEAMVKLRIMRRMAAAKGLRLVDVFELPEIKTAIDQQMQPVRSASADSAAVMAAKAEADELRGRLAAVVPKLREVTEALTREKKLTARLRGQSQPAPRKQGRSAPVMGDWWFIQVSSFAAVATVLIVELVYSACLFIGWIFHFF